MPADSQARNAVIAGTLCYAIWGLVPLVFQVIGRAGPDPWEILTHRVLWGLLAAALMVGCAKQWGQLATVLRSPKVMGWLTLSALLIAANWVLFIWAVNTHRTLETSLGYYVTPLINMAAGAVLFRERIDRIAAVAMAIAAVGVVVQALAIGHLPWMSIALAISFGGYGIVRKRVAADAQTGLFIECLLLFAPALAYVVWLQSSGHGHFGQTLSTTAWLIASGPITAAPLALFAWAARRMPLSTMGFLQFLAPSISFGIGVAEGEPFTPLRAVSFVFIWAGAAVFAYGAWRKARALKHLAPATVATVRA